MNKEWIELIFDNWSQITVLLGVIGFIIKTMVDLKVRKQEIKFSYLQQSKKAEVKEFYKYYLELERKLKEYLFITAQNQEDRKQEVRVELLNRWERFELSYYHVRLFLPDKDIALLDEIKKELEDIHLQVDYFQIDKSFGVTEKEMVLKLRNIRDEIFPKRLPILMKRIEDNLRKDYGIK